MNSITGAPVTAAIFAVLTIFLSGCIAYDAASTAVDAGATVVSTASDVVTSPFDGGNSEKQKSN
jgi:hypothetical protein